jgi:phosphoglycolate phosphatase
MAGFLIDGDASFPSDSRMNGPVERCSTLLLDLDGTLTDPREGITRCLQYSLERLGRSVPPQAELVQYIGPPLRWTFPRLLTTDDKTLIDAAIEHYRRRYADVGIFENELYPDIPESLKALREEGFRLFVVTSKPAVYAKRIIDHFALAEYFDEVFGPDLNGCFDDKSELIAHILRERSISPERSVMIGDRASDILAGKANGTRIEELKAANPDRMCHSPAEIRDALGGSPGKGQAGD